MQSDSVALNPSAFYPLGAFKQAVKAYALAKKTPVDVSDDALADVFKNYEGVRLARGSRKWMGVRNEAAGQAELRPVRCERPAGPACLPFLLRVNGKFYFNVDVNKDTETGRLHALKERYIQLREAQEKRK